MKPPQFNDKLLVWEPDTGEIFNSQMGGINEKIIGEYEAMGQRAAFFDLPSLDYGDKFIARDQLRERPKMFLQVDKHTPRADGQDEVKIRGVPAGVEVIIFDGVSETVHRADGKIVHLCFLMPGRYQVTVQGFPYQSQTLAIEAVA